MAVRHLKTESRFVGHKQNTGFDCGRACAQAIISCLTLDRMTPASFQIVSQDELKLSEPVGNPSEDVPNRWFTTPEELANTMRSRSPFGWEVTVLDSTEEVLAAIQVSLKAPEKLPTAVTRGTTDHWLAFYQVDLNEHETVYRFVDPIGGASSAGFVHTFRDECADRNLKRASVNQQKPFHQFHSDYFTVNRNAPDQRVPYLGKCVIVAETFSAAQREDVRKIAAKLKLWPGQIAQPVVSPSVLVAMIGADALSRLTEAASRHEDEELLTLLPQMQDIRAAFIKDRDVPAESYLLVTMRSASNDFGLLAVFDASRDAAVMEVHVTDDMRVVGQLDESEPELFWSRRIDDPTPLAQRIFPFARDLENPLLPMLRRLIDGRTFLAHL